FDYDALAYPLDLHSLPTRRSSDLLGVLGLVFHFKKGKNDAIVTMSLFLFTGLLIIVFLNQPPYEPRERDYSLVGSFQTFCIWIGDRKSTRLNSSHVKISYAVFCLK